MDPLAAVKCVGNIVAQPAVDASTKWFNYVQNYKDNIANVQLMRRDLENEQTEVQTKVDIGNRNNEEVVPEVRQWLKDAETFLNHDDWQDLLRDEEARRKAERCCCFGCCWSPRYRHGLSRRAEDKAEGISKMIQKMKDRGDARVTLPSRPLKLASTASNFCKGLKSREEKIDQILAALEKDNVNRIGIYGMGGSGKTTIVQELARRAENEKLFNEIVIAEISQFPDFTRIQNQIADRIGFTFNCHDIDERARNLGNRLMQIKMGKKLDSGEQHGNTKVDEPRTESGSQPKNVVPNEQPKNPRPDEQSKNPGPSEQTKHIKKSLTIKEDKIGGDDGNEGLHKGKKSGDDEKEGQMEKSGKKSGDDKKEGQTEKNGKKSGDDKKEGQTEKSGNKSGDDQKEGQAEKSGKLLVILDNIWKKLELERVGIPPDLEKDFGCKVIVTSRSKDVCKSMDTPESQIFKVGDLKDDEAKSLFRKKVGIMIDNNDYKIISEKILSRCSRLPLSISVLADMLKNQTISVWERILNQMENPSQGEALGVLGDTYSIIEISYNHLGDEGKKMFFLLCCIFPPGSNVRLDDLLRYGIGLGLFQYVNSVVEAIDQAHKWADDLKSLSLLSEVDLKKGEIIVHDDVREAGKTFATKGKHVFHVGAIPRWLMRDSYEKYTIVSMTSDDSYKYLAGRDLPKLQLLRCHGSSCINLGENYFSGMSYLKVLDLSMSEIEAFPPSIGHLQHIETLLLEYCSLKDISCISKLVNLQTLSLKKSNITRLPKEMKNLVKLKLLDLSGCDKLHDIRADIFVKLSHLEALYMKCSFSKWSISGSMARLSELRFLPLHVLEITIQSIKQLFDEDFPVLNLSSYKIYLAVSELEKSSSRDLQVGGAHASDLKKGGWKPLMKGAESLYLKNIEGLENVAPYLGEYGFGKLKRFKVSECSGMKYFINITQTYQYVVFPMLEVLCLEHLPDLVAINNGMSPILFSDLQELTLSHLEGLKSFEISIEQANRLRVLEVKSCKNLEFIFDASSTKQFEGGQGKAKGNHEIQLPCLEKLKLFNLNALRGFSVVETNANDDNDYHLLFRKITFPSLDQMILNVLPKIGGLWDMTKAEEFAKAFPKLRSISLEDLELNYVWSSEFCKRHFSFAKLKELKIHGCNSLKTVCPPSVVRCLDQLELLRIQSCGELEQVVSTEGSISSKKVEMSFPNLLTIDFMSLPVFTHFYRGNMKMEFPALKRLKLNTLFIKTFVKVEKSKKKLHRETEPFKEGGLFNDEIKFPCLEQLYVESLRSIEELWAVRAEKFSTMFPKLQTLSLNSMVNLKYVWSKVLTGPSPNFTNLKGLEICSCDSLESLFPPSATSGTLNKVRFSELQTLKVQSSKKFKYFLEGNVNVEFPVLKVLKLNHLDELKTEVYQSVVFPKLEVLFLENLPDSVAIYRGKSPPNLFSDLQQLTLSHIDGLKSFAISIQQASRLRVLEVKNCEKLEFIFYASSPMQFQGGRGEAKGNHEIRLPCLEKLILANLHKLRGLSVVETNANDDDQHQGHLLFKKIIFPLLDKMKLKRLPEIAKLWNMTKGEEFAEAFPKLRSISLKYLELSHVWSNDLCTGRFSFAKLKKLKIRGCDSLKSVCPLSVAGGLDQLELLRIHSCNDIEQVISNKGRGRDSTSFKKNTGISFRSLLTLDFMRLYDLTYFYKGSMKMEFPVLKDLKLDALCHMKTFLDKVEKSKKKAHREEELPKNGVLFNGEVKFPCLERLYVKSLDSIEALWAITAQEFSTIFPKLQSVSLIYMDELKHVWSNELTGQSPSFVNLKEIEIKSCDSLESLFPPSAVNGSPITVRFSELQTLKVVSSSEFKYFLEGNVNLEFPVLKKLELNRLYELETFAKLANFETSGGGEMDIKNEDDSLTPLFSKKILFPSLEELQLHDLLYVQTLWDVISSEEFNSMFLSLQTLDIANLSKLRYVWNDDLEEESQFGSLENITISGCGNLKSLFSLTSDFPPGSQSTKVISFPKLQSLILSDLENFECLFHRYSKMEFQALKMLTVKRLPLVKVLVKLEKCDPETGTDSDTGEASEKDESENEDDSEPDKEGSSLEAKPNAEADSEDFGLGANTNAEAETEGSGLEGKPNAELEKDDSGLEAEQNAEPGIEDSGLEAEPNAEPDEEVPSLEAKPNAEPDEEVGSGLEGKPNAELEKDDSGLEGEQNAELGIEDSGLEAEPNAELEKELPGLGAKPNTEADIEGSGLEGKTNVEPDEEAGSALEGKPNAELEKNDSGFKTKQNAEPGNENSSLEAEPNANEEGSELELEPSAGPDEEGYGLEAEPGAEEDGLRADKILFRGNVEFSSLVELKVKYMDQLENIYETEMDYVAGRSIFPKLRTLHLAGGSENKLNFPKDLLSKLSSLSIGKFHKLSCLVSSADVAAEETLFRSLSELEKLENLTIKDCDSIENLFEAEGDQDVTWLPNLRTLRLSGLTKLKQMKWHVLPNLQSLNLVGCLLDQEFLIQAPSIAQGLPLQQLEKMTVIGCERMEAIVGRSTETQYDGKIVFPQLKEIVLWSMFSLGTFCSASCTATRLPSLVSVDFYRCGLLRSFSSSLVVTPKLSQLEIETEFIATDEDLNSILQTQFGKNNMVAKYWPLKLKHKLHDEHELKLIKHRGYDCDGCSKDGTEYSYTCYICRFDLHPTCALDESQLLEEPDEIKVGKDWPRTLKHELHENHEFKLVMGRNYDCDDCHKTLELYSYCCHDCNIDLHPKCALREVENDWPRTLKHELHESHELKLVIGRKYRCDGCSEIGADFCSYYCQECDFDLHPKCALPDISAPASA